MPLSGSTRLRRSRRSDRSIRRQGRPTPTVRIVSQCARSRLVIISARRVRQRDDCIPAAARPKEPRRSGAEGIQRRWARPEYPPSLNSITADLVAYQPVNFFRLSRVANIQRRATRNQKRRDRVLGTEPGEKYWCQNFFESAPRNLAARALDPPAARGGVSSWLFSLQLNGWQRGPTSCSRRTASHPTAPMRRECHARAKNCCARHCARRHDVVLGQHRKRNRTHDDYRDLTLTRLC